MKPGIVILAARAKSDSVLGKVLSSRLLVFFGTYSYGLYRGVNELTPPSQSGAVGSGNFTDAETLAALMGTCTVAGFSENLYVYAMAIDGWSRLSQYDAGYVLAFALAPH